MNRLIKHRRLTSCQIADSINRVTEKSRDHLTPELKLALVTPQTPAYKVSQEDFPFQEPYWAFYWPGGQVLTRYLLDSDKGFILFDIINPSGDTSLNFEFRES
ncbi:Oidioi.mRNA.OKI2018_I69.chr2.g6606.t1.cds [Oikopleura dioica]|uniref:Oidioi.mRNA.OKI2018_I69.chr2.g6606.t1.cds n=1 Tax=Oikopleura dioica TaxID=34765 RepID=A0ABN7T4I8_OIKDI|nr:Oidioi.mRNA.OKI2018_I69.chr2.g6606.t1.cds [Oikopleura dioica]